MEDSGFALVPQIVRLARPKDFLGFVPQFGVIVEGQRQLARRCAMLAVECEKIEALGVAGQAIDLDCYGQLTDRIGRAFQRLGLKRVPRDVTPTLETYLATRKPAAEDAA